MDKPKIMSNGRPVCGKQILYMLHINGGRMKRGDIRKKLNKMGYGDYCIYEAYCSLKRQNKIEFEGPSHSPNQVVILSLEEQ